MNIANENFHQEWSAQQKLSTKVEPVKDLLSENWETLKLLSSFCSLSTFDILLFLFVLDLFMICDGLLKQWYFFISPQWKGLNIRINDLKMQFYILFEFRSDEPIQL